MQTNAITHPSAVKFAREMLFGVPLVSSIKIIISEELMIHRSLNIEVTCLFGEIRAYARSNSTDERLEIVLLDFDVG